MREAGWSYRLMFGPYNDLVLRSGVSVLLLVVFYSFDWMAIRTLLRDVLLWLFTWAGYRAVALESCGSPALGIGCVLHWYSAECTYQHVSMLLAPFTYRVGIAFIQNVGRMLALGAFLSIINLMRTIGAIWLDLHEVGRFLAHDLPNVVVCCLACLVVLLQRRSWLLRVGRSAHSDATTHTPSDEVVLL